MSDRHDTVSERQILALALSGHPAIAAKFVAMPHNAWYSPTHELVATVLRDRITRRIPINAQVVSEDVASLAGTDHKAEQARRFVLEASMTAPPAESFSYYAEQVLKFAAIRTAAEHCVRLSQHLNVIESLEDMTTAVRGAVTGLTDVQSALAPTEIEPPLSLQDLLDAEDEPYDWLIPDLLERMDRLILTGFEGTGKSVMLGQLAMAVASGIHPFAGTLVEPNGFRVMVLDCENSRKQLRRRYQSIVGRVNSAREMHGLQPIDWSKNLRMDIRPDGVDLTNAQEFARIEQSIAATAPDLVVAGPLYRMHKQNINEEQAARELVDALDRLRVKYRFTLICEAHVGHGGEHGSGRKLRPTGSSLFLRWPEFGYGIRAFGDSVAEEHPSTVELVAWRGSRDERRWPSLLRHSKFEMPWTPVDLAYRDHYQMGPLRPAWAEQDAS